MTRLDPPTITVVQDLDSLLTPTVPALNDPAGGRCAIMVRPNLERLGVLAADIQHQLGHVAATAAESWQRGAAGAAAWMAADGIDHLVVGYAETLRRGRLDDLTMLCQLTTTNLWLVLDTTTPDHIIEYATSWGADVISTDEFLERLPPTKKNHQQPPSQPADAAGVAHVPDDALTFLATAKRTLPADDFALVLADYKAAFDATDHLIDSNDTIDEEVLGQHLWELLAGRTTLAQITTLARGLQAAALHRGYHVRIDPRRFLDRAADISTVIQLTGDGWALVAQRCLPNEAAIAVLAAIGLDSTTVAALQVHHVAQDASTVTTDDGTVELPEESRPLMAAYLLHRQLLGDPDDTYLLATSTATRPMSHAGVRRAITKVTARTGIAFRGKHDTWTATSVSWRWRWGISVQPVTP